jgi:transposase InsO family protein
LILKDSINLRSIPSLPIQIPTKFGDLPNSSTDSSLSQRCRVASYQAPNANAFAERWVRTVREECLDHLIILNERHLHRVLKEYCAYYNARRPHQGLEQDSPAGLEVVSTEDPIHCREVLGGVIRDYYQRAA